MTPVALTSLSHGAGCGCKLPAGELWPVLESLDIPPDPRLLVGTATGDDAAVIQVRPDLALVQTVDFFTPIVDDPFEFGRIAAANALSDVYAMGGEPLSALNLIAFPLARLGPEILTAILRGGLAMAAEAGCAIVGGHSIDDPEPKYGLAVTGTVDPSRMLTNAGARPGDALVLTKPLGAGAITTAAKRGRATIAEVAEATRVMTELNASASRQALAAGASAATDVTGFGLAGHLHNLCRESGLAARIDSMRLPVISGALEHLASGCGVSGGGARNAEFSAAFATYGPAVPEPLRHLAADPCTSGGLLVAIAPQRAGEIDGTVVGACLEGAPGTVSFE